MPRRRAAALKTCAATMATLYLVPALLPGLSGLSHDVFHVVAEPVHADPGSVAHSHPHEHPHEHSHEHPNAESAHTHAGLVDALLTAGIDTDDTLEDAHVPQSWGAGPGLHLPQGAARLDLLPAPSAVAPRAPLPDRRTAVSPPPIPPPRA